MNVLNLTLLFLLQFFLGFHANTQAAETKKSVLIVSHFDGEAAYLKYTVPNHELYAKANGYGYEFKEGILSHNYENNEAKRYP